MGKIQVLDKLTIDKIAAGEVVERPLSVAKELIENAMDANADSITVEIKDGGISYLRVTDNGSGIAKEDIKNAFLPHATSKIVEAEDLNHIQTLGFRGEALSSISAVAFVELITKTRTEMMGNRLVMEGGKETASGQVGAPDGTTMIVRNLFYNTPARKKFLKSSQAEAGYISGMMEHLSLSHPEIAMRLIVNGQTKLQTAGNGNLEDVIYRLYGRDVLGDLIHFEASSDHLTIRGLIGKPALSRGNRSYEHFFVNGRYIKSNLLSKAVEEGYKSFIMQHKFPFVVLSIVIDSSRVDVNVHPTKMEVRFSEESAIYDLLVSKIRETLSHQDLIIASPMIKPKEANEQIRQTILKTETPEPFEASKLKKLREYVRETSAYEPKYEHRTDSRTPQVEEESMITLPSSEENTTVTQSPLEEEKSMAMQSPLEEEKSTVMQFPIEEEKTTVTQLQFEEVTQVEHFLDERSKYDHRIIGQVFKTYWLVEFHDSLYIIDQHAAHERIIYERMMKAMKEKEAFSQQISPPMVLHLTDSERNRLNTYKEEFLCIGFEYEEFGGQDIMITKVPYNMYGLDDKELFLGMLDELTDFTGRETPEIVLDKIAMMSCKAAVKGNQHISEAEARQIIEDLLQLDNPYHCPHGRPTIIEFKKTEIEKRFHR